MKNLNFDVLDKVDTNKYQQNKPYPYINFAGALYDDVYKTLAQTAPSDLSIFEKQFGIERKFGQKFHDKYFLKYTEKVSISNEWRELIRELHSDEYQRFLERLFGIKRNNYDMVLSWHYMPRGTQITPHCDTKKKIGTHIFYLNTSDTWNENWGGQTLAMDDHGRRDPNSGPALSEFDSVFKSKSIDNNSFIFTRTEHSWHAVDVINCPDGVLRKMFSVVLNRRPSLYNRIKQKIKTVIGR